MQGARSVHVLSVQPLCLENLSLRGCCQDAWFLSGKQQVAKENQQVRAKVRVVLELGSRNRETGQLHDSKRARERGEASSPFYSESDIPGCCQVTGVEPRLNANIHSFRRGILAEITQECPPILRPGYMLPM